MEAAKGDCSQAAGQTHSDMLTSRSRSVAVARPAVEPRLGGGGASATRDKGATRFSEEEGERGKRKKVKDGAWGACQDKRSPRCPVLGSVDTARRDGGHWATGRFGGREAR